MPAIEISILGQKYLIRSEEREEHLREVAEMVRRKVESIRKQKPSLTIQKAAMLAAFDFASESIKGKKKGVQYRSAIMEKAHDLLSRIETELGRSIQ